MNAYPSWIHRIPEIIETLELTGADRIDRQTIENLFDLRKTAFHLLRRLGAERRGHSLVIARARLMARLRERQEHPDWRWERERHEHIRANIDDLRPSPRRSLVPNWAHPPKANQSNRYCRLTRHDSVCARQSLHLLPEHGAFGGTTGFGR